MNLVAGDMKRVLAEAEAKRSSQELPPMHDATGPQKKPRQRTTQLEKASKTARFKQANKIAAPGNVFYLIGKDNLLVRGGEPAAPDKNIKPSPHEKKFAATRKKA